MNMCQQCEGNISRLSGLLKHLTDSLGDDFRFSAVKVYDAQVAIRVDEKRRRCVLDEIVLCVQCVIMPVPVLVALYLRGIVRILLEE